MVSCTLCIILTNFLGLLEDSIEEGGEDCLSPWLQSIENPWRAKAKGKRVLSVLLWLYCDDTLGNVSKKWNKHNSILFTLAGLSKKYTQLLYNIHFVATSNQVSPLEMAEVVKAAL